MIHLVRRPWRGIPTPQSYRSGTADEFGRSGKPGRVSPMRGRHTRRDRPKGKSRLDCGRNRAYYSRASAVFVMSRQLLGTLQEPATGAFSKCTRGSQAHPSASAEDCSGIRKTGARLPRFSWRVPQTRPTRHRWRRFHFSDRRVPGKTFSTSFLHPRPPRCNSSFLKRFRFVNSPKTGRKNDPPGALTVPRPPDDNVSNCFDFRAFHFSRGCHRGVTGGPPGWC